MKRNSWYAAWILMASIMAAGCDADVSFLTDLHVDIPDAGVESSGFECSPVKWPGSKSQSPGLDIGVDGPHLKTVTNVERDKVDVKITLKDKTLHKKSYSTSFLESDEVDHFEYKGSEGLVYIWRFWGSDGCDFDLDAPE